MSLFINVTNELRTNMKKDNIPKQKQYYTQHVDYGAVLSDKILVTRNSLGFNNNYCSYFQGLEENGL